jgi:hypothetical protein
MSHKGGTMPIERTHLKMGTWQTIDSYCSLSRIGVVIFQDMLNMTEGYVEAYRGDHFHDARHLLEFERRCILHVANRDRDWFTYKCGINWYARPTGTDYSDDDINSNLHSAFRDSNPLAVVYKVWPNWEDGNGNTVKIQRIINRQPEGWNLSYDET